MKKILALLLSFCAVLTLCVFPVTVDATDDEYVSPISDDQLELVDFLGCIDKNFVRQYEKGSMSRGGTAYYIERIAPGVSHGPAPTQFEAIFKDVTSEHKYYTYIKALVDAGIMQGFPDGTFRPDDAIDARDAALVFLNVIGYKEYIALFGLDRAIHETNILDGVKKSGPLTIGEYARMMWNALHAPTVELKDVSTTGGRYVLDDEYLGIYKLYDYLYGQGVITGVPGTKLQIPDQSLESNEIYIGGTKYEYNKAEQFGDAKELLGYNVNFYFCEYESGIKEIFYITKSDKNEEMILKSDDIERFSNFTYHYWKNNNEKTISITDNTDILYNGIASPMCSEEDMVPEYGTVTLINNDGKKGFEVVKIDSYEFILVNNVDVKNKIFYDVTEGVKLDLSQNDDFRIIWEGDDYPIERIIYGDFLAIKRTADGSSYVYAEVEVRKDDRPVTKIDNFSLSNLTLTGGGKDYVLWSGLSEESKAALKIGATVTLYFSPDGTIVRVEKDKADDALFGYLINVAKEGTLEEEVYFRFADSNSVVGKYTMGKTLKIDGVTHKSFDTISSVLATAASQYPEPYYSAKYPYAQPIKYELSESGNLKSIDTIIFNPGTEDSEKALRLDISGGFTMRGQNTTLYTSSYDLVATITGSTSKFKVPFNYKEDEENYSVLTWSDGEYMGNELIFNVDERISIPEAIYDFRDMSISSGVEYLSRCSIVKEKVVELGEDNEIEYKLVCFTNKTEETYTISEKDVADVDTGDVIRVELNADMSVKEGKVELVFDASIGKLAENANLEADGKCINFGTSSRKPFTLGYKALHVMPMYEQDGILSVKTTVPSDGDEYNPSAQGISDNMQISNASYYKYSNVRGNVVVEQASAADMVTYDVNPAKPSEMILAVYYNGVDFIYFIENED